MRKFTGTAWVIEFSAKHSRKNTLTAQGSQPDFSKYSYFNEKMNLSIVKTISHVKRVRKKYVSDYL